MAVVPMNHIASVSLRSSQLGQTGSSVRELSESEQQGRRAERRVIEFMRAQGLYDEGRLEALAQEIVQQSLDDGDVAVGAVARMQQRWESFVHALVDDPTKVDPLWLRSFISTHPQHCLGPIDAARQAARNFGDAYAGSMNATREVVEQRFVRLRFAAWLRGLVLPTALVSTVALIALHALAAHGLSALESLWIVAYCTVFALPATGASIALLGAWRSKSKGHPLQSHHEATTTATSAAAERPRTAVLLPIYHEDAESVFASVAAMRESLEQCGAERIEIFVLSDSRDPLCAADEERAFRRIASSKPSAVPVYYRRRAHNTRQKAGNLAELFERFGDRYTYALILDADSLMTGAAMLTLIERMEAAPQTALIQASLQLHGGRTLLARMHQLTASVCGPLMMRGLARWSGDHANYYGHNAIVRVRAFMECCGLPQLSGAPPFGGHFLSHDFVEAALLARAGWHVSTAWDVNESWEQMPQSLHDYVARDRRWCQGNLQHLRIVAAEGLKAMSRIHFLIGALSYVAAPLLLMFIGLTVALIETGALVLPREVSWTLAGGALLCLCLPRWLAWCEVAFDAQRRGEHGGLLRLSASMVLEQWLSMWLAPLSLLHHTQHVLSIALGRAVGWGAQNRSAQQASRAWVMAELPTTLFGLSLLALGLWQAQLLWWLAPLWLPCLLAVPTAWLVSSRAIGRMTRMVGLLDTAPDRQPHPLLQRVRQLRAFTTSHAAARFRDVVLDPVLLATHLQRVTSSRAVPEALYAKALRLGPAALSPQECALIEQDADSMRRLHREAWRHWPTEAWDLARIEPQLPATVAFSP